MYCAQRPCAFLFVIALLASCGTTQRSVAPKPHGYAVLQAGAPGHDLTAFLTRATRESEAFRQELFVPSVAGRTRAEVLADAVDAFRSESTPTPGARVPGRLNVHGSGIHGTGLVRAMAGDATVDGQTAYGPFTGRWFGSAPNNGLGQHWGGVTDVVPPLEVRLEGRKRAVWLQSYQYAWLGDGYGVRLEISLGPQSRERVLLGYVVRVDEGHLGRERARQPRVGLSAGAGRLIWITPDGVVLEEAAATPAGVETYSVSGFRYRIERNHCRRDEPFQAVYTRSAEAQDNASDLGK